MKKNYDVYYARDLSGVKIPSPEDIEEGMSHVFVMTGTYEAMLEVDQQIIAEFGNLVTTKKMVLETIYRKFNSDQNPLSSEEHQANMLRDMDTPHTSMSIGDVVQLDGELWIAKMYGWERITK